MTQRERILAVYRGDVPDAVPYMLDLSHWFYHRHRLGWDLDRAYEEPERELIDCHRRFGAGFYMPNLGSFFTVRHPPGVRASTTRSPDRSEITWSYETPLGTIRRTRRWYEQTYSWAVSEWGIRSENDLQVLAGALEHRGFEPRWDRWRAWTDEVGDLGVVYLPLGYSAMGQLLHYWLGVEGTVMAAADWPDTMRDVVGRINANNLALVDLVAGSPAEIVVMGDNFSGDVQPPGFFRTWSGDYYEQAVSRLHAAGKRVAVHIDGRLRGALGMIRDTGADAADAVTPRPMGDLSPAQCREEAGPGFILSGGVSPNLWLPGADIARFRQAVLDWLELRRQSPRLIANAGDQVPPGAAEDRIHLMRDLVEAHGRY
jgi:hypothetical protein